jgi:hypothetical protein
MELKEQYILKLRNKKERDLKLLGTERRKNKGSFSFPGCRACLG